MILLAGPCAAESEQQLLATARALPGDTIFRAGIWKPRTRPTSFQGAGNDGLAWLSRVKQETGLPVATEVASAEHVRAAVAARIDYLWLGARTTANPILVQQLADALAIDHTGVKAVLVKNPVNDDAALWLGDIARIEAAGVSVMAVHRGCGHRPCWKMAHTLRTERPDIPLLLDPSHMSGDAAKIPALVGQASALALDGLMVEVHPCPAEALSDAKQQLLPEQYRELLPLFAPDQGKTSELTWLRAEMDEIDDHLWQTIQSRMQVSARIGQWKKQRGMPPLQPERFAEIMTRRLNWAQSQGLSGEFVKAVMSALHEESCRHQE